MKLTYNDEDHAYYLDGVRCKSVTTVAKIPDDTYTLEMWKMRQVAIGMAMSPPLVEAVAAHVEDRDVLNNLCEKAKSIAKADEAAQRGTAAHRITELHDEGKTVIPTPLAVSITGAWSEILDAAGLDVVPEWMERIVCYPEQRICGKFDRILRRRSDGRMVVADLKTGAMAIKYPHSIAIQMALYAYAPWVAGPLPSSGGTTEEFGHLPDVDTDIGYIIHIPATGMAQVATVDIAAGWKAVQEICFPTLRWRARKDLVLPYAVTLPPKTLDTTGDDPFAAAAAAPRALDWMATASPRQAPATIDEGATIGTEDMLALSLRFRALGEGAEIIRQLAAEAHVAGHPFSLAVLPSQRRFELGRALMTLIENGWDEEVARALVGQITNDPAVLQNGVPLGAAIGLMTIDEATRLAECAAALGTAQLAAACRDDGSLYFVGPTIAA